MGPRLGAIANELGLPLMPWQQQVANVGLEVVETYVDGRVVLVPAFREVWISVPRQNGKTTLVLCWALDRALYWGSGQNIIFSSQTANDGRRTILDEWVPRLERSPFWPLIGAKRVRRAAGSEGVRFRNGSRVDVLANSKSSGHGRTLHFGVIDEAWDDVDNRRVGAIGPAQITVPDAQILGCSTMGTDESTFLNNVVDLGREATTKPDASVAYFEWSAGLDEDIQDPRVQAACNPAWDYTITAKVMGHQFATMPEGEFRRAHLNQRTSSSERVISAVAWARVCDDGVKPEAPFVFAVDSTPDRARGSIAVADRQGRVEVVWTGPENPTDESIRLAKKYGASVAVDPAGPAGAYQEALERAGVKVVPVTGRDMAKACGAFYDAVIQGDVKVRTRPELDAALAAATKKVSGDTWTWARKGTSADISPLVAVTEALWAAQQAVGPAKYFTAEELWSE